MLKKFIFITLALVLSFGIAKADYEQTDYATYESPPSGKSVYQQLGTGLEGSLTSLAIKCRVNATGDLDYMSLWRTDDDNFSVNKVRFFWYSDDACTVKETTSVVTNTFYNFDFDLTSSYFKLNGTGTCTPVSSWVFDSEKYYYMSQYLWDYGDRAYGSDTDLYAGGEAMYVESGTMTTSAVIDDMFFSLGSSGSSSEDSGTIAITKPVADSSVSGLNFEIEATYWNYAETQAPYTTIYWEIADGIEGIIKTGFAYADTDNVEEEKEFSVYTSVLNSYTDVTIKMYLYHTVTGVTSDSEYRSFDIFVAGATNYDNIYSLWSFYEMPFKDGRPAITFNNTNEQLVVVVADIEDIACDDIAVGFFDFNSYTDNSYTIVDQAEDIDEFVKGGLYNDCQMDEVFLYLDVDAVNPGPVYYQVNFYDDTGQTDLLNYFRFVVYYDVDEGVSAIGQNSNESQSFFCDDLTFYIPNYIGDDFEVNFFNNLCSFMIPPPGYFTGRFQDVSDTFQYKFAFIYQIKDEVNYQATVIAGGSVNPPSMQSGEWLGASFQLSDMFQGTAGIIVWFRSFMSILLWIGFCIWLLRSFGLLFTKENSVENNVNITRGTIK